MDLPRELAHEIQAPLTSLELRLVKLCDTLPQSELAQDCLRELDALKRLVVDFLALDAPEVEPSLGALGPVFSALEKRFLPIASARRVTLVVDGSGARDAVFDRGALERVLTNLVDNALKFSAVDGVVHLRARGDDGRVELEVRDEGAGIAPEAREHIFEPFYRVDREAPGHGLGLAISKRLAEAQGGSLRCDSELGRGSSFIVTLAAS